MIRRAVPADLDALLALYRLASLDIFTDGPLVIDSDASWTKVAEDLHTILNDSRWCVLVAEEGGAVVGYELAYLRYSPPPLDGKPILHCSSIYILPEYRKGWVARKLGDASLAWGVEQGAEWAECRTNINSTAQRILERGGFRVYGVEMRKRIARPEEVRCPTP